MQIYTDFYRFLLRPWVPKNPYKCLIQTGKKSIHPYPIQPNLYYLKIGTVLLGAKIEAKISLQGPIGSLLFIHDAVRSDHGTCKKMPTWDGQII